MLVKFHARGVGRGSGPIDYLLGKDRKREDATLDRGNPEEIQALIDGSNYAKKYTSGVLSFQEPDLDRATKEKIMSSFEKALLPGLDADQYSCLWVEHKDKGRLELNFVVPNIELQTGKRLQPYYDKADRPRINAWKVGMNASLGLHDPDDPMNRQAILSVKDLPKQKQEAAQTITDGLLKLAGNGDIKNRDDVVSILVDAGFTIARQTKQSISIADPDGGRNIRLKGLIYEQNFGFSDGLQEEIESASARYRAESQERIQTAREDYRKCIERKRAENQKRHKRPESPYELSRSQDMALAGSNDSNAARSDSRGSMVAGEPNQRQLERHQQTERNDTPTQGQGRQHQTESVRRSTLHSSGGERRGLDEEIRSKTDVYTRGILNHDRTRETAFGRLGAITRRTRETAQRVYETVRGFVEQIRGEPEGKHSIEKQCLELNSASRTLDGFNSKLQERMTRERNQELEQQRQRTQSRGFSR